jgi:hypothetical protein
MLVYTAGHITNHTESTMPHATLEAFLDELEQSPRTIEFSDTMAIIDSCYDYTPAGFTNGDLDNAAGENEGSCKLFTFAALNELTEARTLACFGAYYRDDVIGNLTGTDHQNIRNFLRNGWAGMEFEADALEPKE